MKKFQSGIIRLDVDIVHHPDVPLLIISINEFLSDYFFVVEIST